MIISLPNTELLEFVVDQINSFFPSKKIKKKDLKKSYAQSLDRIEFCFENFKKLKNSNYKKYYRKKNNVYFNHLNIDHYTTFLYFLSNNMYKNGIDRNNCDKIYGLLKIVSSCDIYYEVNLPDVFLIIHPVGSVIGRANYSNYITIYQNCMIGSNHSIYPTFEEFVVLRPGSMVLGNSRVGKNSQIAAGSIVIDKEIKPNHTFFGNPSNFKIKKND